MVNQDNPLPLLRGTAKDHKVGFDPVVGPEMRPIMGANVGPNTGLAQICCEIIRAVKDTFEIQYEVKNTEELLSIFKAYNDGQKQGSPKLLVQWISNHFILHLIQIGRRN